MWSHYREPHMGNSYVESSCKDIVMWIPNRAPHIRSRNVDSTCKDSCVEPLVGSLSTASF